MKFFGRNLNISEILILFKNSGMKTSPFIPLLIKEREFGLFNNINFTFFGNFYFVDFTFFVMKIVVTEPRIKIF